MLTTREVETVAATTIWAIPRLDAGGDARDW